MEELKNISLGKVRLALVLATEVEKTQDELKQEDDNDNVDSVTTVSSFNRNAGSS